MGCLQNHNVVDVGHVRTEAHAVEMTATEHLERIRDLVRILLTVPSPGLGPLRVGDWDEAVWTEAQRSAYAELRVDFRLRPEPSQWARPQIAAKRRWAIGRR